MQVMPKPPFWKEAVHWLLATCESEHMCLLRGEESTAAQCLTPVSVEGVEILFSALLFLNCSLPAFLQQPSQISLVAIVITLSIKTLKLRSGIHWAVTALIKKTKALVSTCLFGKVYDCFGWCIKQTQYYSISTTVQELIKRCQQTPNCDFFKRYIF